MGSVEGARAIEPLQEHWCAEASINANYGDLKTLRQPLRNSQPA